MQKAPFFIIGCVRSGTTFLRDTLRNHPNLVSPEETHFFRWTDAFGTPTSLIPLLNNQVLKKHRKIDGVSEEEFKTILHQSISRADLQKRYMKRYMENNQLTGKRWFDKTPQNAYGSAMIANQFPKAKFIHIIRHPMDVVSSLRIGNVVKIENLIGACNNWNEAAELIHTLKKAYPKRVYELKYEALTDNLLIELEKLLYFVDEDFNVDYFNHVLVEPKQHEHDSLFSKEERNKIMRLCGRWLKHYGYV